MADAQPPTHRRTRFVCVSDTHNASPNGAFQLPKGDVLIHAGDLTNQGSYSELNKSLQWIEDADFEAKIVIAGNHDITLDTDFYAQYGLYFHNQNPQNTVQCQNLLSNASSITYLNHSSTTINLSRPNGPHTTFKVFGSPYSPQDGMWAFGYNPEVASQLWEKIPLDSDIVVTHTPPKYHCDERRERRAVGCEALRNALWRVRPRLAVFGHVHEGRGVKRVLWDLGISNVKYKELGTDLWTDPGNDNKKMSLVDLTTRRGKPLLNDGSRGDLLYEDNLAGMTTTSQAPVDVITDPSPYTTSKKPCPRERSRSRERPNSHVSTGLTQIAAQLLAITPDAAAASDATRGQGGIPPSTRCDLTSLSGRLGRQETCMVNAAMMASSWPHNRGGKKFNKPIVVDLDLPVWG